VSEGEIDTLFRPLRNRIGGFSFGTGLPVVVELLARIGGKLEVMTQRDRGTTLWAHFPVESPAIDESSEPSLTGGPEELDQLVDKVVSIRRFSEG
jgi:K+-sensing histidine kinase KdpD